jgi:hypothetical protein
MRIATTCWTAILCIGTLTAQNRPSTPPVRRIKIRLISTNSEPLRDLEDSVTEALKNTGVALERRFDPGAADRAESVIRDLYAQNGQTVRVEHTANQFQPGGVEIAFEVIQLCACVHEKSNGSALASK